MHRPLREYLRVRSSRRCSQVPTSPQCMIPTLPECGPEGSTPRQV